MMYLVSGVLLIVLHHLVAGAVHRTSSAAIAQGKESARKAWLIRAFTLTPLLYFPAAFFIVELALPSAYAWAILLGLTPSFFFLVHYTCVDLTEYAFDNEEHQSSLKKYTMMATRVRG